MEEIVESFASRGVRRGGVLFLTATDALALIDAARAHYKPILGVDSFVLTETTIQPFMEHILDLSSALGTTDTWSRASSFVEERKSLGFHFEVVL